MRTVSAARSWINKNKFKGEFSRTCGATRRVPRYCITKTRKVFFHFFILEGSIEGKARRAQKMASSTHFKQPVESSPARTVPRYPNQTTQPSTWVPEEALLKLRRVVGFTGEKHGLLIWLQDNRKIVYAVAALLVLQV